MVITAIGWLVLAILTWMKVADARCCPGPLHGSEHPMPRPEVHDAVRTHWRDRIAAEVREQFRR